MTTVQRRLARWTAALLLAATGSGLAAAPASAHPTDEIVQQTYLTPDGSRLDVQLVITPGVLVAPAFVKALDSDGDGKLGPAEQSAHTEDVTSALTLQVDGTSVPLKLSGSTFADHALLASGGGSVTLDLTAVLPDGSQTLTYTNSYDPPGTSSTVAQANLMMPTGTSAVPADVRRADEGRTITAHLPDSDATTAASEEADEDSAMLDALRSPLSSPWALLALVGTCALLGAFHALTPGHGKALLASYLVGAHSTPRQAVALGSVITVTHTSSVIALGTAVLFAGQFVTPGVMVPILQVASGVVVLFLGVRLLRRRWPGRGRADQDHSHSHSHSHSHKGHRHSQEHEHRHDHGGPGHSHSHSPGGRHHHHPVVIPTTFRGIAALGVSGGIIPCPEALTVLLLAVGLGRTALGIIMIFAFSIGLAAVLVGLGLILVSARSGLERFRQPVQSPLMQWLPATSALVVSVLGLTIAVSGVGALTG
ncbi:hypothetical protein HLK59_13410 [Streptomyces sp. S3(2020)]|uniref:HoxN/HupN/NixA family nickel/cobalt transporter n=1 Tax=Streptomyces sp. S3(2020) TaxID=2732044 RepID=UPI001489BBA7|nr:hypothetical protein [Streptomyces sp. S3(2020)]